MKRLALFSAIATVAVAAALTVATTTRAMDHRSGSAARNPIATSCLDAIIQARLMFSQARLLILAAGLRIAAAATETDPTQTLADVQQAGRDLTNALHLLGSAAGGNPPAFEKTAAKCWRWASENG